jgi:type II secretory pathway pseudopilin PulG
MRSCRRQRGALLMGLLIALAIAGYGTVLIAQRWSDATQRQREEELLDVGLQYRLAIESYVLKSPNGLRQYPSRLRDLVSDPRFAYPVRHMRRLYRDPLAPDQEWGLVRTAGGITGVYSQAPGKPFRSANFDPRLGQLGQAKAYADWKFVYGPAAASSSASATSPPRASNPSRP